MNLETLRKYCLSLPYVAENVQWDQHLVFRIETSAGEKSARSTGKTKTRRGSSSTRPQGKIFCIANLGPEGSRLTFKCTPEVFAELVEMPAIIPAPYMARNHWASLERWDALSAQMLLLHVKESYNLVWEKLPKSLRKKLESGAGQTTGKSKESR